MPAILPFPIETRSLLSQFNKRNHTQNQGEDNSDVRSPVVMVGLVIAALTLFVAAVPLFRCPRFRRWLFNPGRKALGIATPANPPPTTTTAKDEEDLNDSPVDNPTPDRVLTTGISNTSPYGHNHIRREEGGVPQVGESLGLRRPPPAFTWPFSRK